MKTRTFIPDICGAIFVASVFLTSANAQAVTSFEPDAPHVLIDFEDLGVGDSVSTIGWTGKLDNLTNTLGAEPRQPDSNPSNVAIQAGNETTRRSVTSPTQTVTPAFSTSDTLYFSGWFNRTTSGNSGGAVLLNGTTSLGGFGIRDTGGNGFVLYANGAQHISLQTAAPNTWYEIALVIDLNADDISLSLGYLFVRDVTAGESEFTLIDDLAGISMGYTDVLNATQFSYFSTTAFRVNAQIDNLAAGVAIPEPGSLPVLGLAMLFVWQFLSRKRPAQV